MQEVGKEVQQLELVPLRQEQEQLQEVEEGEGWRQSHCLLPWPLQLESRPLFLQEYQWLHLREQPAPEKNRLKGKLKVKRQ